MKGVIWYYCSENDQTIIDTVTTKVNQDRTSKVIQFIASSHVSRNDTKLISNVIDFFDVV